MTSKQFCLLLDEMNNIAQLESGEKPAASGKAAAMLAMTDPAITIRK